MKRKGKTQGSRWIWVLTVAVLALVAGYFVGAKVGKNDQKPEGKELSPAAGKDVPRVEARIPEGRVDPEPQGTVEGQKTDEARAACARLQEEVQEFFRYLNGKPYVRRIEDGLDTSVWFKRILYRLAAHPPVPSGEGLDAMVLASNVFHLFRNMEGMEIRLIQEILQNEASTLEMNLDLFFRWFSSGDRCPDPKGWRPPPDVLYAYAGFFLNTVGGRSYLFRRLGSLRMLVSYYCLLILHEAEQKGKNTYGMDPAPHVSAVKREMDLHPGFLFHKEYTRKLEELEGRYKVRMQQRAIPLVS